MAENKKPCGDAVRRVKEAVSIDARRVYDSCADKDCLSDLRVYFTDFAQEIIDSAVSVRCRSCEVLNVFTETERTPFNRGYYSVDMTFFFIVGLDVFTPASTAPVTVYGLCVHSKKAILYGSEGGVKVFSSEFVNRDSDVQLPMRNSSPVTKVHVAQPICLDARLCRLCECVGGNEIIGSLPRSVCGSFEGEFRIPQNDRAVRVTIGVFSTVQLERDVQILIPAYDFNIPRKECSCETEDPCDAFRRISFPVDEFFPPNQQSIHCDNGDANELANIGCNCAAGS
ncbi:MAG: hypothetical protein IK118_08235 [Clostridia bacterium]|nr:hypothetical protein [Clostridia bacterium]MBR5428323.1 hypothetical protein [Clostridia bacterium]